MQPCATLIIFQWGLKVKSVVVFVVAPLLSVHTPGPPMSLRSPAYRSWIISPARGHTRNEAL